MAQPHKHHDGPIDAILCHRMIEEFKDMQREFVTLELPEGPIGCDHSQDSWMTCKHNWLHQFWYCVVRLREVQFHLSMGEVPIQEYHGKVIDICLSVKDDFERAKTTNFTCFPKEFYLARKPLS